MSSSFRRKLKYVFVAVISLQACRNEDSKDKPIIPVPAAPNTCKAMVNLGTWPGADSVNTWVYGCFEGYDPTAKLRSYFAEECKEATIAPGFEFVQLDTKTCPTEEVTSICEGTTFKIVAYKQDPANFDIESFRKYCESKSGKLKIL